MGILSILWPLLRDFRGLIAQEISVRAAFFGDVALRLVGVRAQHIDEEMRGNRLPDRIGLRESPVCVPTGELQQADMIARVGVERRELAVGAERHRHEKLYAVLLAGLRQHHHAIEEPIGALFGRHLRDIGGPSTTAIDCDGPRQCVAACG